MEITVKMKKICQRLLSQIRLLYTILGLDCPQSTPQEVTKRDIVWQIIDCLEKVDCLIKLSKETSKAKTCLAKQLSNKRPNII